MEQFYRDFEHLRDHFTPPFSSRALFSRSFLRVYVSSKEADRDAHIHLWTDRQTDRQTKEGEYNKTSRVYMCLIYQYKRVNICRDVRALFFLRN